MQIFETKEVRLSFVRGHEVLRGVDLVVNRGEVVVILGPSGSGKSVLLRCLNGLECIDSGKIIFEGTDLNDTRRMAALRRKIGFVFQDFNLFSHLNVLENITLARVLLDRISPAQAQEEARKLLAKFGLAEKERAKPRELSGGQKQRIAILRELIGNPDIMIFDEPTSSLDPTMVTEVLGLIEEITREKRTTLLVTHEIRFARRVASRIIFMDQGQVVANTTDIEGFFNRPPTDGIADFLSHIHR
ncbi:MAG: amino acid ABC transporter ATP-binding protein [bacterium]